MNRSNGDNTHSGYCRGAGFTACALLLVVAALKALKLKPWAPTRGGRLSGRMGRLRTARRLFEARRSFWAGVDRLLGKESIGALISPLWLSLWFVQRYRAIPPRILMAR